MNLCQQLKAVTNRQLKQPSTWRGIAIGLGTLIAVINPAAGAAVFKAVGVVVAAVDVLKNDSK